MNKKYIQLKITKIRKLRKGSLKLKGLVKYRGRQLKSFQCLVMPSGLQTLSALPLWGASITVPGTTVGVQ